MACQQILSSIFDSAIKKLNSSNSEVNSNSNSAPLFGYVHVLNHGNAIFITDERQSYLISIEYIMLFRLKTGDRLQARVAYSASNDRYIVNEIIHVQHITYDNAPIIKTNRNFNIAENNVGIGTSVLVPVKDNMDIATKVAKIISDLPQDMVPFLLSFDGRPTNFDVPNTCFTKTNYNSREKLMACLLTFFQVKQQADTGKDVVLIIDSLDKMFSAFNNCMQSAGTIDPNLFSTAALSDFESILCSSGSLKAGGSLTIIGLHRTGNTPQQLQITDRLHQIMDTMVEIK